jgi:hypothetical protein
MLRAIALAKKNMEAGVTHKKEKLHKTGYFRERLATRALRCSAID